MKVQASMSRSDILLECGFSFERELPEDAGDPEDREAADYGSGFHELMAARLGPVRPARTNTAMAIATRWNIDDVAEFDTHVRVSIKYLQGWLKDNPFRINWSGLPAMVERAMALKPGVSARYIAPANDDHVYEEAKPGEIPGTGDYITMTPAGCSPRGPGRSGAPRVVLVLDHKTGDHEDFSEPVTKAQLRTLGAAAMRVTHCNRAVLAVLHSRRRGMPKIYADAVSLKDLEEHELGLARGLARIGDGSMKPGAWCKYCMARTICPTRDAELLERSGNVLEGLTAAGGLLSGETHAAMVTMDHADRLTKERKLGALYVVVQQAERLAARIRTEMRNELMNDKNLLPETPDGRILTIQTFKRENLSKSSIVRAYGKVAGETVLKRLRKAGAIEESEVNQLHLMDNDNRAGR